MSATQVFLESCLGDGKATANLIKSLYEKMNKQVIDKLGAWTPARMEELEASAGGAGDEDAIRYEKLRRDLFQKTLKDMDDKSWKRLVDRAATSVSASPKTIAEQVFGMNLPFTYKGKKGDVIYHSFRELFEPLGAGSIGDAGSPLDRFIAPLTTTALPGGGTHSGQASQCGIAALLRAHSGDGHNPQALFTGRTLCWLCGCPIRAPKKRRRPEEQPQCEHILPALRGIMYKGLISGSGITKTTIDAIGVDEATRKRWCYNVMNNYLWAHATCNGAKGGRVLIKLHPEVERMLEGSGGAGIDGDFNVEKLFVVDVPKCLILAKVIGKKVDAYNLKPGGPAGNRPPPSTCYWKYQYKESKKVINKGEGGGNITYGNIVTAGADSAAVRTAWNPNLKYKSESGGGGLASSGAILNNEWDWLTVMTPDAAAARVYAWEMNEQLRSINEEAHAFYKIWVDHGEAGGAGRIPPWIILYLNYTLDCIELALIPAGQAATAAGQEKQAELLLKIDAVKTKFLKEQSEWIKGRVTLSTTVQQEAAAQVQFKYGLLAWVQPSISYNVVEGRLNLLPIVQVEQDTQTLMTILTEAVSKKPGGTPPMAAASFSTWVSLMCILFMKNKYGLHGIIRALHPTMTEESVFRDTNSVEELKSDFINLMDKAQREEKEAEAAVVAAETPVEYHRRSKRQKTTHLITATKELKKAEEATAQIKFNYSRVGKTMVLPTFEDEVAFNNYIGQLVGILGWQTKGGGKLTKGKYEEWKTQIVTDYGKIIPTYMFDALQKAAQAGTKAAEELGNMTPAEAAAANAVTANAWSGILEAGVKLLQDHYDVSLREFTKEAGGEHVDAEEASAAAGPKEVHFRKAQSEKWEAELESYKTAHAGIKEEGEKADYGMQLLMKILQQYTGPHDMDKINKKLRTVNIFILGLGESPQQPPIIPDGVFSLYTPPPQGGGKKKRKTLGRRRRKRTRRRKRLKKKHRKRKRRKRTRRRKSKKKRTRRRRKRR